jgi:hypothetical protein
MTFGSNGNGDSDNQRTGRPPGSMIGTGIAIGTGLGVAMGVAFDNLALGIAIGAAIGVAIGAAMEQGRGGPAADRYGSDRRMAWVVIGLGLTLLLGVVATFAFLGLWQPR